MSGAARLNSNLKYLRNREGRGCGNKDVLCVNTFIERSVFGVCSWEADSYYSEVETKEKVSAACTGNTPVTDSLELLNEKPQLRENSFRSIAWWHYF